MGTFKDLRNASWKGVDFDYQEIGEDIAHAVASHEYPNRPGGDQEDLGRRPQEFHFRAVFAGELGLAQRDRLLVKFQEDGPGDLIHPIWGPIKAIFRSAHMRHSYSGRDYAEMDLEFVEDSTKAAAFTINADSANAQAQQSLARARQAWQGFGF